LKLSHNPKGGKKRKKRRQIFVSKSKGGARSGKLTVKRKGHGSMVIKRVTWERVVVSEYRGKPL